MLILIDKKIPQQAKERLSKWGELVELETEGVVYPEISGHPDIFLFQYSNNLIISPQLPENIVRKLHDNGVNYNIGSTNLGFKYPQTAAYNVSAFDTVFIGNSQTTEKQILELAKHNKWIESPQAYSRCNSIILDRDHIVTSEITVCNSVNNSLFVNPKEIVLKGFPNGFFGGCVGLNDNKLFLIGSLKYHSQGQEIKHYCNQLAIDIIELYDGPFFDGGGIFFL
jgi:hypothetical protein